MSGLSQSRIRPLVALFVLVLGFYVYFYQAGGWNQNSRFDLVRALVEQHSSSIDTFHGNTGDKAFRELEVAPEKQGSWRVEQEFVDAIREGAPVTHTNFEDGLKYMEFTEAVQLSLSEGRRIDLPLS